MTEQISVDLAAKLAEALKLNVGVVTTPTKNNKEGKYANQGPLEDYSKGSAAAAAAAAAKANAKKLTPAQKSLAKVSKKGMKSITSFFGGPGAKKAKMTKP